MKHKKSFPFFDEALREMRRTRRKKERRWRKTKNDCDWNDYLLYCDIYNKTLTDKKEDYYKYALENSDPKVRHKTCTNLLNRDAKEPKLPE